MICTKLYKSWSWESGVSRSLLTKEFYLKWGGNFNKGTVYFREIKPKTTPKLHILLLHGMRFSSKDWVQINTLSILAKHGYRVIAMDLPGYGKSSYKVGVSRESKSEFLWKFIDKTELHSPVIVSPSMSGSFSLSYLAASKPAKAFVSIAVVGTDKISIDDYAHFPPTLIVQGSEDKSIGKTSTGILSSNLPDHSVELIKGAGHACYLDKPEEFHDLLLKFLQDIVNRN